MPASTQIPLEGSEGRTLGGGDPAKRLANLEYQLEGGVPGGSLKTGASGAEAASMIAALGGTSAAAAAITAALRSGLSMAQIAARLGTSQRDLAVVAAELGAATGIAVASEEFRPEEMGPSLPTRFMEGVKQYLPDDSPDPGPIPTVEMERGGLAGLADRGRHGDSMLVHMAPDEVAGIAALTQNGVTINPDTGLPEMFNLRDFLPAAVTIGAGLVSGGTLSPLAAAALSGVTTAAVSEGTAEEKIGKGILGAVGTYGTGQLMSALGGAGAAADPTIGTGLRPETAAEMFATSQGQPFAQPGASALRPVPNTYGMTTGNLRPFGSLGSDIQAELAQGGITSANYPAWAAPGKAALLGGPPTIPAQAALPQQFPQAATGQQAAILGSPYRSAQPAYYALQSDPAAQQSVESALNPAFRQAQGRAALEAAGPIDRLEYAAKGLGQVDLSSWDKAAAGKIPVGDLAGPAMATAVGIGGLLPQEEVEFESKRSPYAYEGPYYPEQRRRREPPPGYIPGVSPQFPQYGSGSAFAMGGTSGRTVGGLPTLYAREGMNGPPPGHFPAYITPKEAGTLRAQGGGVAPDGGQYMVNGIPAFFSEADPDPGPAADAGVDDGTPGGMETPGFVGEQGFGTPSFGPSVGALDAGAVAQQQNLDAAFAASMHAMENPNDPAAQAAAHSAEMGLSAGISAGGLGRFSPAVGLGINSEMGRANFSDLSALNAQDSMGYAIGNPQPTEAGLLASRVAARENPTMARGIAALGALAGPPVSLVSTVAGLNEPALSLVPGFISEPFSGITSEVSDAVSAAGRGFGALGTATGSFVDQPMADLDAALGGSSPGGDPGEGAFGGEGGPDGDAPPILPPPDTSAEDEEARQIRARQVAERQRAMRGEYRMPPQRMYSDREEEYRPGVNPQFSYFAQEGTGGMTIEENIDVEAAVDVPPVVASTTGIMQGAPVEVQGDVEARLSERPIEEPQNPRERAIYDRTVLALQNELEPEVAQRAIDEFLDVFGPEAFRMLQEMLRGDRENGGIVEPANGETTVAEGEIQGPDVIAGKIVDPVTGEETANLRVGENEYIEPAASLARRAQVAGMPPTPENGAMLRGEEEEMLRRAVG